MRDTAIRNIYSDVTTVISGSAAWDNNGNVVTLDEALITAEVTRLQAIYDSQAYARSRKQEYDKLNQFEMQFDDNRDGTSTWVDSILAIKDKFPKP
jgi:hypothetical protein